MPKSRQRKKHTEKKKKFIKSQLAAKELHKHRMNKYVNALMEQMRKKEENERLGITETANVTDSPIEGVIGGLQELKEGIEEAQIIVDDNTPIEIIPDVTPVGQEALPESNI